MKHRWNIEVHVSRDSEIEKKAIDVTDMQDLKQHSRTGEAQPVPELKKNETEWLAIQNIHRAVQKVLGNIGLEEIPINQNNIHIIDPDVYSKNFSSEGNDTTLASLRDGHVYVRREGGPKEHLISDLTHEIAHEISYIKSRVSVSCDTHEQTDDEKTWVFDISKKQRGYGVTKNAGSESPETIGGGLNEGMTEIFANALRHAYCEITNAKEEETALLTEGLDAYIGQMFVIEDLYEIISPNNPFGGYNKFMQSFITGDTQIFRDITQAFRERGIPDAMKILLQMDKTAESALRTAQRLGLSTAAQRIKEYISWNNSENEADA